MDERFGALTPHIQFLEQRGYSIHSYSGNYAKVNMMKGGLCCEVNKDGTTISFMDGLFTTSSGPFQNSHPRFDSFEQKAKIMMMSLGLGGQLRA